MTAYDPTHPLPALSAPAVQDRRGAEKTVGVALGAGAARGWAHIGVLEALEELGVRPAVVAGCSSGALVGASYAGGRLPALRAFAETLTWRRMLGFFDLSWRGGGLIEGRWLSDLFRGHLSDDPIEQLPIRFGAVATELRSGRERWLTRGSVVDAVRASISLPGLMTPHHANGLWLVDGALVNPLPVSLCRALGADVIIGVSMQRRLYENACDAPSGPAVDALDAPLDAPEPPSSSWLSWMARGGGAGAAGALAPPRGDLRERLGYLDVLGDCFFHVQGFVARVRLAADPVDVLVAPAVDDIGLMDFHKGASAIEAGRAATLQEAERIRRLCGLG